MEFEGVYHHWDSYPSGLGQALFWHWNRTFGGDTEAMLKTLIDEHPAGWSTVIGTTFSKTPGFRDVADPDYADAPQCLCHGTRSEPQSILTARNASKCGVEYAYVFDGDTMLVLGAYCANGEKMVGMFGRGDPRAEWRIVAEVDMHGPPPDWDAMQDKAEMGAPPVPIHKDRLCKKTQPAR